MHIEVRDDLYKSHDFQKRGIATTHVNYVDMCDVVKCPMAHDLSSDHPMTESPQNDVLVEIDLLKRRLRRPSQCHQLREGLTKPGRYGWMVGFQWFSCVLCLMDNPKNY